MLSTKEQSVLKVFQQYLVDPGQMLCFDGQTLERHRSALQQLTAKDLLVKEQFKGGYSLTRAGFEAMKQCDGPEASFE